MSTKAKSFFKHGWNSDTHSSWAQIIFFFILINAQTIHPRSHYSCFMHFTSHWLTKQIKCSISDIKSPPCSTCHFKLAVWSRMDLFLFAYKGLIFHSETAACSLKTKRQAWQWRQPLLFLLKPCSLSRGIFRFCPPCYISQVLRFPPKAAPVL